MAQVLNEDETREAILDAATEGFARDGIKKTTMRSIAERVGIDVAELKGLFTNKSVLALSVQVRELDRLKEEYIKNMPDATLDETIKFIIRSRCEFVEKNSERTILFFRNAFMGREPWSKTFDWMVWQLSIEFATLVEKSVREGYLRKDTDINIAVRAIVSFYLTGIVTMGLRAKTFKAADVWAFIEPQIDILLEGLKA